jgi:hypothetical protein
MQFTNWILATSGRLELVFIPLEDFRLAYFINQTANKFKQK